MSRVHDGVDDYCEAASSPIAGAPPFTIAVWYKPTTVPAGYDGVFCLSRSDARHYAFVGLTDTGRPYAEIATPTLVGTAIAASALPAAAWAHIAGTFASGSSRIHVNGVAGPTDTTVLSPAGLNRTTTGALWHADAGGRVIFAPGRIGYATVWDAILTGQQLADLAAGAAPDKVQAANLVGYWKLLGAQSPEPDSTAAARSLTVSGATADTTDDPPIDSTAPTTDLTGQTRTTISRVPGWDAFDVTITANEPFVEYELRRVAAATSTRTEGSQIETAVVSSTTSLVVTVTDDELVAALAAEGANTVKAFTKDAAGNWST